MNKFSQRAEWNKVAHAWHEETQDTGAWHQCNDIDPIVLKLVGDLKRKNVLEVGCGNGYLSRILARKGAWVKAVDISDKLLNYAIKSEKSKPLGIAYLHSDASNLKTFKAKGFDIVVANMSLMDIAKKAVLSTLLQKSLLVKRKTINLNASQIPTQVLTNW